MAKTETCICDACNGDLTSTTNCEEYRLVLASESLPPHYVVQGLSGGFVTDMAAYRPINRTHHFCDLGCLASWLIKTKTSMVRDQLARVDESLTDVSS